MARNDGLRDYQQEMKLRLFEEWELHRSVMVQMPTGTGKTHLLAAVVKEFLCGGGVGMRVWIVAHRIPTPPPQRNSFTTAASRCVFPVPVGSCTITLR